MVVDFSQPYSPPTLNVNDIATSMYQLTPNPSEKELSEINETLANVNLRVFPYGENAIQIVASGKSWQMQPGRIESLARAAAKSIALRASESHVKAKVTSETRSRGRVPVPKTILADFDRTKR
jgi:hypothetical protein